MRKRKTTSKDSPKESTMPEIVLRLLLSGFVTSFNGAASILQWSRIYKDAEMFPFSQLAGKDKSGFNGTRHLSNEQFRNKKYVTHD